MDTILEAPEPHFLDFWDPQGAHVEASSVLSKHVAPTAIMFL